MWLFSIKLYIHYWRLICVYDETFFINIVFWSSIFHDSNDTIFFKFSVFASNWFIIVSFLLICTTCSDSQFYMVSQFLFVVAKNGIDKLLLGLFYIPMHVSDVI